MQTSPHRLPAGLRVREAHAHLLWHGQSLDRVDLSGCVSPGQALELIGQRGANTEGDLFAGGARPEAWDPPRWPTLDELDAATGDRAAVLWCFDTHAAMVNSRALHELGLSERTPDPGDGVIGRDEHGRPNGVLAESAVEPLRELERRDPTRVREQVRAACADLLGHGFDEVHDLKTEPWLPSLLAEADFPMPRLVFYPLVEDLPGLARERGAWETRGLRLGGGKLFADGTLNSRTAWMLEDWADAATAASDHPRGVAMHTPAEIESAVRTCVGLGLPIACHAIGDGAARAVLDAIERVGPVRGEGLGGAVGRHRIEHAQLVHPDDVPRFAALGVVCSMQPCHLLYDIEALHHAVPDRLDRAQPIRSLIEAGSTPGELLWFGSDTPVVRPDPGDSLQAAIERRRVGMPAEAAIGPREAISPEQAAACFALPG
mgnify:CR=1 FL=1